MDKKKSKKATKVKYPIGLKLITIFSILVILVLGISTAMVSTLVRNDERVKAEETNHTINSRTAENVETIVVNVQNNAEGFFNNYFLAQNKNILDGLFEDFCLRNPNILFVYESQIGLKCTEDFEENFFKGVATISRWISSNNNISEKVKSGDVQLLNVSTLLMRPAICIVFPYTINGKTEAAYVAFSSSSLIDLMSTGSYNTSFLVNKDGEILVHPDSELTMAGTNVSKLPAFIEIEKSNLQNGQYLLPDENDERWFYAYHKLVGGMISITAASVSEVYRTINHTTNNIILISLAVFFVAIMLIRFFSNSLTRPIIDLVGAAHKIQNGHYILKLKPKTRDEVGLLTTRFVAMGKGLAERERLKDSFSRFTNKSIAEKAMRGELKLGGENRNATIFFSDIRSFTAMSEKLTPAEVVEFLNEYMTKMVSCVIRTHGTVDKYIGDAIMAVWGAPETAGSPAADAWNAVNGALMMRYELYHLNQKRAKEGKPPVKIGCGINTGSVVAGQIGSDVRMEYTVIGDAVNLASRTEALNKPFQTDILITENTYNLIKDKVVVEEMPSVHVKGKEDAIHMYAVINIKGHGGPTKLNEVRKMMGYHDIDKSQVNTDEEEKKYKIGEK